MDHITPILAFVAEIFGVSVEEMRSKRRTRAIVEARQAAAWVLRKRFPRYSLCDIGRKLGVLDHSTVVHALNQVEQRMRDDAWLAGQLHTIASRPIPLPSPAIAPLIWWGDHIRVSAA